MKSFLFILVAFVAITALLSGIILMSVPDGSMLGLPVSMLEKTIFRDYRLPGFFIFLFIGGLNLTALYFLMLNGKNRFSWTLAGGAMTLLWILIQWILIDNTLITDLVYFIFGMAIVLLSLQFKGRSLI